MNISNPDVHSREVIKQIVLMGIQVAAHQITKRPVWTGFLVVLNNRSSRVL